MLLFFFTASFSQQSLQLPDSIQKRFDRLEQAHINLEKVIKKSGQGLQVGAGLFGFGIGLTVLGSIVAVVVVPKVATPNSQARTLSGGQITGITLGLGGLACTIIGLAKIGVVGRKMKHLNPNL